MLKAVHFRAHARRRVHLRAVLWDLESAARDGSQVNLVDVSLAGACIDARHSVQAGQRIRLQINAPTLWDPLVLSGATVWSRPFGASFRAGVRFHHTTEGTVRALFDVVGAQDDASAR